MNSHKIRFATYFIKARKKISIQRRFFCLYDDFQYLLWVCDVFFTTFNECVRVRVIRMDSVYYYVPLFTILGCLITQGNSIKCYICSFSPYDRNNRTDKCTEENFQHQKVYSDECKLGCESVVQYDANDEMEQWKRNCLQEGHKLTNDCQIEKTPVLRLVRCTCDRDLCNSSVTIHSYSLHILFAFMILIWRSYSNL